MNALSLLKRTKYIGAKELRLTLDKILRDPQHPYRVMLYNKPAIAILPDEQFIELLEVLEELKDSGLLEQAINKLHEESKEKHPWFWTKSWQEGEREADKNIRTGKVKQAGSARELLQKLKK